MHVDRAKFLILTSAIATGCGASQKPAEPPVIQATAGPDYDTSSGGTPAPDPGADAAVDGGAQEAPPEPPRPVPGPVEEFGMPPPPVHGPIDPKLAKQCESLKLPSSVCESFAATVESCKHYPEVMQPKAAEAAVKCLTKRSGSKRICEFGVDAVCAVEGSKAAKTDSTASQSCASILGSCAAAGYRGKDLSKGNCVAALSAFKSEYRNPLISCITEFCEIGACFYQMR